jgi:hypothetical protein
VQALTCLRATDDESEHARVSEPAESERFELPSYYVDTAHVRRQPFTVHLMLGRVDPQGEIEPSLHVTLSPEFCRHLGALLLAAAERTVDDE